MDFSYDKENDNLTMLFSDALELKKFMEMMLPNHSFPEGSFPALQMKSPLKSLGTFSFGTPVPPEKLNPLLIISTPFRGTQRTMVGLRYLLPKMGYIENPMFIQKDNIPGCTSYIENFGLNNKETIEKHYLEVLPKTIIWDMFRFIEYNNLVKAKNAYTEAHINLLASKVPFDNFKIFKHIRDPRDSLVSTYFFYYRSYTQAKMAETDKSGYGEKFKNLPIEDILIDMIDGKYFICQDFFVEPFYPIRTFIEDIIACRNDKRVFLIDYEQVHADPHKVYRDALNFLTDAETYNKAITEEDIDIAVKMSTFEYQTRGAIKEGQMDKYEKVHRWVRKGITGDWKNHFKDKVKNHFKEVAGDVLIEAGYEKDNDW